jgi:hypothetical protein
VVEQGDYLNARVYGHVAQVDLSDRIKGHTSMMLRFDRLVMPDGRRAPIHAEILELYRAPSGEKHRFGDRRRWRTWNNSLSRSSEDHFEQRSGNVDPNHRTMTIAET